MAAILDLRGNNRGYKVSKGKYILLLNNDTWVGPEFIQKFMKAFDQIPNIGSVQPKLVLMDHPEKLDSVGSYREAACILVVMEIHDYNRH